MTSKKIRTLGLISDQCFKFFIVCCADWKGLPHYKLKCKIIELFVLFAAEFSIAINLRYCFPCRLDHFFTGFFILEVKASISWP